MTRHEAEKRIAELRQHPATSRTAPENLDGPCDPRLNMEKGDGWHKFTLLENGDEVSWGTVVDFRQQIGNSVIRMGGIAGVGTRGDRRFRGYSRCVVESALRWMRQHGYHASMLHGIPSYYPKFGYAKAFPDVHFSLAVRDAECAQPDGYTFVPFDPRFHLRPLLRMYHRNNAGRTGVIRRNPRTWRPFRKGLHWSTDARCEMVVDARRRPVGYIVFHVEHLTADVMELGFETSRVYPHLLVRAAAHAWDQRLETITFHLPEDDAFMAFCRPLGLRRKTAYARDGGPMVRLIDVPGAMRAVSDEWAGRIPEPGMLNIRTNLDNVRLEWDANGATVSPPRHDGPRVSLPQWGLAQLLYGYCQAETLAAQGVLRGSAAAIRTLGRLFPPSPHYQHVADDF